MRVEYVVTVEVAPGHEQVWSRWQSEHHVPEVLREQGFIAARKLQDTQLAEDGWIRYVMAYTLEDRAAFERYTTSPAATRLRADFLTRFGKVTRVARQVLEELERFSPAR